MSGIQDTQLNGSGTALDALLVIGSSTGGPEALAKIFAELPSFPGAACCIAQHMPAGFTRNLARRLNQVSAWRVLEGQDGEVMLPGSAYVAPGGFLTKIVWKGRHAALAVCKSPDATLYSPSIDALFESAVDATVGQLIAVLLTGMGKDGAMGMKAIFDRRGITLAQAEESCVVFGMPKAAIGLGAAQWIAPLDDIAAAIAALLEHGGSGKHLPPSVRRG